VATLVGDSLQRGDRVLAVIPLNGPLLYYLGVRGIDTTFLTTPDSPTRRRFRGRSRCSESTAGIRPSPPERYVERSLPIHSVNLPQRPAPARLQDPTVRKVALTAP
jgi:hypothetical protein